MFSLLPQYFYLTFSGGPNGENIAAGVGGGYNIEKAFGSWANEDGESFVPDVNAEY